jgi:hypothetical protein
VKSLKSNNENSTKASYWESNYCKCRRSGETPIKPNAVEMATCVLGEESKKELETIQLLNNAVKCRI